MFIYSYPTKRKNKNAGVYLVYLTLNQTIKVMLTNVDREINAVFVMPPDFNEKSAIGPMHIPPIT